MSKKVYLLKYKTGDYYQPYDLVGIYSSLKNVNAALDSFHKNWKRMHKGKKSRDAWVTANYEIDTFTLNVEVDHYYVS